MDQTTDVGTHSVGTTDTTPEGSAFGLDRYRCFHQPLDLYEKIILLTAAEGWIEGINGPYPTSPCQCVPFVSLLRRPDFPRPPMHRVLGSTAALHRVHPLEWCADRRYDWPKRKSS